MLFTMICTCPFLQESGEFSLSSLHPPIRQRTASCTWVVVVVGEGLKKRGKERERERGEKREGRRMTKEEEEMMQRREVS